MKSYFNVFRIVLISLGIAAATLIALDGFKVPVNQPCATVLDAIRVLVAVIAWPFENFVVAPVVNWLHGQNVSIDMHDHWQGAFILLWLLFGVTAKSFSDTTPVWTIVLWSVSGVCALAVSFYAGSAPLASPDLFLHATHGFFIFLTGVLLLAWFSHRESQAWIFVYFLIFFLVGSFVSLLDMAIEMPVIANLASPGLAMAAATFAVLGVANVIVGAFIQEGEGDTFWQQWFRSNLTRAGFDILAVLMGAAAMVYAAHSAA